MENHRMLGTEGAVVFGTEGGPGPTGVPNTTAAAEAAGGSGPRTGVNGQGRPDPAVLEKPVRRRFDAEYKARILREADQVTEPGQLGALLRREGLYSSHLSVWRKQRDEAAIAGLGPKRRGRKPDPNAVLVGTAACSQGRRVRFYRVTELVTLLLEAKDERNLLRLRQQLAKLDLLILDELGYVPASKAGAELLFDVITTAYERNSVIVTTNLPFENWTEVLGSERLTGAALDRLTHRYHIPEAKGESYRLKDAKRRRRRTD